MSIQCLLRGQKLKATPEEKVRQAFIAYLIYGRGVPLTSIAIECPLSDLPHLKSELVPVDRRIDLVVFTPPSMGPKPLLLVECKAENLTSLHESQLFGYNAFVKAPYAVLVGATEIRLFGPSIVKDLPTYQEMLEAVSL